MRLETEELNNKICLNCFVELDEESIYCKKCGQKTNLKKVSLAWVWNIFVDTIFNFESGYLFTIKELTIRPAKTVKNYLNGQRKKYYNPLKYLFLVTLIYFVMASITGYENEPTKDQNKTNIVIVEKNKKKYNNDKQFQFWNSYSEYFAKKSFLHNPYSSSMNLLSLIPISIISFIIFRKKKKEYSFTEHIVLYTYTNSHITLFSAGILPLIIYFPIIKTVYVLEIVSAIVYTYFIKYFFDIPWLKAIWKNLVITFYFITLFFSGQFVWFSILYRLKLV